LAWVHLLICEDAQEPISLLDYGELIRPVTCQETTRSSSLSRNALR